MSDIRYNGWLHRSGTGGVYQDSSGRVGIGTSIPSQILEVQGGSAAKPTFRHSAGWGALRVAGSAGGSGSGIIFANNYSGTIEEKWSIYLDGANDGLRFTAGPPETTTSEKLRITSSGLVGVGTDSIAGNLEIYNGASKINALTIRTGAGANGYAGLAFASNQTYAREKAAIYFQETSAGAHHKGDIVFAVDSNSGDAGQVASSDEKARITSAGNLLIGKNSVYGSGLSQVHATGQYTLDVATWAADANGPTIDFYKSRSASKGTMTVVQSGDVIGRLRFLGADGANGRTAAQITVESDGTPGTNDMPGRIVFATTADGASSSTERLRIKSDGTVQTNGAADIKIADGNLIIGTSGHGIDFAADGQAGGMSSELLDDYEEGLFNPGVSVDSGSLSVSGSYAYLAYTKVGRMVHVSGHIVFDSASSPSGNIDITGLPFACAQMTHIAGSAAGTFAALYANGSGRPDSVTAVYQIRFALSEGNTTARLEGVRPYYDGSIADWFGNGADLLVNFCYTAAH